MTSRSLIFVLREIVLDIGLHNIFKKLVGLASQTLRLLCEGIIL